MKDYSLASEYFKLATVGLGKESKHDDSCCGTIELRQDMAGIQPQFVATFYEIAREKVEKVA
jgi:hypothetical protein